MSKPPPQPTIPPLYLSIMTQIYEFINYFLDDNTTCSGVDPTINKIKDVRSIADQWAIPIVMGVFLITILYTIYKNWKVVYKNVSNFKAWFLNKSLETDLPLVNDPVPYIVDGETDIIGLDAASLGLQMPTMSSFGFQLPEVVTNDKYILAVLIIASIMALFYATNIYIFDPTIETQKYIGRIIMTWGVIAICIIGITRIAKRFAFFTAH